MAVPVGVAGLVEDPRQELPVAACPTLLARRRDEVVRRELVEELDIGHQAGTGEDTLEQVVAQQRVLRHAIFHGGLERVEVVDPLAGEASFLEQVLVHVGDCRGIRVDPRRTGEDPLEDRSTLLGRKRRGDPRLQHAVALDHPTCRRVEGWLVEWVGNRPDELPDSAAGQPRVGVERDHVAHVGRRDRRRSFGRQDAGRGRAAQQCVQFLELAALALPPHPATFGLVPRSLSMQEQEPGPAAGSLAMPLVELINARGCSGEQFIVADNLLGGGVEPVREQRESEIAFAIGEIVNLQPSDQSLDVVFIGEQHRNHHERAKAGRHTVVEVQARQRFRAEHPGDHQVDKGDRQVGGRHDREHRDDDDLARDGTSVPGEQERYRKDEAREDDKRAEVSRGRVADIGAQQPGRHWHPHAKDPLESRATVGDEVVAGVSVSRSIDRSVALPRRSTVRHLDCLVGDVGLGQF